MELGWTILVFGGFAAVAAYTFWFSAEARLKRRLRQAPRVRIADAPEGELVRIAGRVAAIGAPLVTPLGQQACVYYEVTCEHDRGKSGTRRLFREAEGTTFLVEDGSGTALVELLGARMALTQDGAHTSGTFDDPTPEERALLERHRAEATGLFGFNKRLQFRERSIAVGEHVTVLGRGVREPDPGGAAAATGYRGAAPTRLCLTGSPDQPLEISDDRKVVQAPGTPAPAG